jgi:hypothetical protein
MAQERDEKCPLVCRDECPKQMIGETRVPIPVKPGQSACYDTEYVRTGPVIASCLWLLGKGGGGRR